MRERPELLVELDGPGVSPETVDTLALLRLAETYFRLVGKVAMIVACAVRHRAEVLVTTDAKQRKLASSVGLRCAAPSEFATKQLALKQIT